MIQNEAVKQGCQQVLWLYGEEEEITEVGTMNLFIYWTNENGGKTLKCMEIPRITYKSLKKKKNSVLLSSTEKELVTPPLDGIILPGVTRQSLLDLARSWVGTPKQVRY